MLMDPTAFKARWDNGQAASANPAGVKTSARLAMGQAASDQATAALQEVQAIEGGGWSAWHPFGAGAEHGKGTVDKVRSAMSLARVPQAEIDRLFPKDYNPSAWHATGGPAQRLKEAADVIKQQQSITNTAVAHTQGREEPADTGP